MEALGGHLGCDAHIAASTTGGLFFDLPLPFAVVGHEGGTVLVVLRGGGGYPPGSDVELRLP
jgi:hypothetical protein